METEEGIKSESLVNLPTNFKNEENDENNKNEEQV